MRQIPDSITNQAISQALDSQDSAFFLDYDELDQNTLDGVFVCACKAGVKPEFIDTLMNLTIEVSPGAQHRGCTMTLKGYHYDLLYHILKKYGKRGKKNIHLLDAVCEHSDRLEKMLTHEKYLPLFSLMVNLSPNHTQRIRQADKYYSHHDCETYSFLYNQLLSILQLQYIRLHDDPATQNNVLNAMKILCHKKFPVCKLRQQFFNWKHVKDFLPQQRKQSQLVRTFSHSQCSEAMASHVLLANINNIQIHQLKIRLLQEISRWIKAPTSIESRIASGMNENFPNRIPNKEEYDFLQSLEAKPYLFKFFSRYYLYERRKIYEHLNDSLIGQIIDDNVPGSVSKI